ncbi:MAG: NAD(P)H-hydrate dehydratase [Gammaproteobacteria bacterium]|nr:NAD(P)H-hydrate dehydratase [Gammaproteobacteria bacterium]
MNDHENEVYLTDQVRELDRTAIEEFNISSFTLMQRAAEATFSEIKQAWPKANHIIVLAGTGNNGGDGYVIASLALAAKFKVEVIQVGDHAKLQGDAKKAHDLFVEKSGLCTVFDEKEFSNCDVIVDALLGTGLTRAVKGDYATAIELANHHAAPILSVDIPSGLNANNGCPLGVVIQAETTVTFVGMKLGLLTASGRQYSGKIIFNNLQIPKEVYQSMSATCQSIQLIDLQSKLGKRDADAHKGDFGRVLVVGGNAGMAGSVMLAAEAAARSGSGLVSVATLPQHATAGLQSCREIMVHGVSSVKELNPLLKQATVVAIGPGLGQDSWAKKLLARIVEFDIPMVVDADALNLLAAEPMQKKSWILTPHPGEAARLLKSSTDEVQENRLRSVQDLQKNYGGVAVLKGSGTLIAVEDDTSICIAGNPGMATGGMGDVLTGIIAGLMAQGLSNYDAARFGVQLHAQSADLVAEEGMRGMLASDLFVPLRRLVNC